MPAFLEATCEKRMVWLGLLSFIPFRGVPIVTRSDRSCPFQKKSADAGKNKVSEKGMIQKFSGENSELTSLHDGCHCCTKFWCSLPNERFTHSAPLIHSFVITFPPPYRGGE